MARHRRLTADKRGIKDFPKLPSATSFIRKTLTDCRKSNSFATLGKGIEHKIKGNFWTFATFKRNSSLSGRS
ncbi:MAG: hypothetical protein COS29_00210 [Candidatus Omnitrophica bacterium CG02_land_8_20_14_3_00__42_8]|nr:MAG: hypothetical protein COS29_00210 [Candidatus Omnitrophica bacterium CG02_land_8_20_14_3_00__42_8]